MQALTGTRRLIAALQCAAVLCLCCSLPAAGIAGQLKSAGWRLADASSPYLQLHADNPVEWYPWGQAAFDKAHSENKPLFISIGYFTCHWCHVMARESFENPGIAALLNEHFVPIKVDREQRPDLDAAYMQYVTLTSGQGGWPMSVWATPEGAPFLGGTYFPPEAKYGKQGFKSLLGRLAELWRTDEQGIRTTATHAMETLRKLGDSVEPLTKLDSAPLVEARREYAASFDELQGGFGPAPKFPQPARLLFLLADDDPESSQMALVTLDHMLAGGIFDQLAGGFHRYSTDFGWRVPHFEKMLYDQALMARVCLTAWQHNAAERYAGCVRRTLDFTLTEMRDERGGFYSALSADSRADDDSGHMQEGAYYTWNMQQLKAALPDKALREWAVARYGIDEQGNALGDPLDELQGRNVLWHALEDSQLAIRFKVDSETVRERNAQVDMRLLAARRARAPVPVDDKVVTAWNGYQVTALALAGRLLDEPRYIDAAKRAARFVLDELYDENSGQLFRDWRGGVRGVPGFDRDYAAFAEGLLALYRVSGEKRWLQLARQLVDAHIERFWDDSRGGFFTTTADTELWLRNKPLSDEATVSGNGIAVHVLLDLGRFTGNSAYTGKALRTARWAGAQLADAPGAMPYTLMAWPRLMAAALPGKDTATQRE
jgi:uncharacterized protein YyaL (SSP411 family)